MSKRLTRKINNLERKVLKKPEWGTTKIVLEEPVEIALWEECNRQASNFKLNGDVTPNERFAAEQLAKIAWWRAVDVFVEIVGSAVCRMDETKKQFFMIDLLQFVNAEMDKFKVKSKKGTTH